jgi:HEAT repeat protein
MPIVPSRAERVHALVRQLASERSAERDSAVAQLTLLGPRAVEPLLASLADGPTSARLAALEVLERLGDRRARPAVLRLVHDPSRAVARRAIELAGQRDDPGSAAALAEVLARGPAAHRRVAAEALARLHGAGAVEALAPLVDTLVDDDADTALRLAVLDALLRIDPPLPRSTLRPLHRRLASSRDPRVAARAADLDRRGGGRGGPTDVVERLRGGEIPADEARKIAASFTDSGDAPLERLHEALDQAQTARSYLALAVVLGTVGGPASIPVLSRALARVSDSEGSEEDPDDGLAARAAIHSALAALDSRVALHDLRELIGRHPRPVMPALLGAAAGVGDASLVPALARAASEEPALLEPCASTFVAIARREKLRRSSAALRRVRAEHRGALDAFFAARRRGRR